MILKINIPIILLNYNEILLDFIYFPRTKVTYISPNNFI